MLSNLIETAYRQNPTLRAAGGCVLKAQVRRGIAIGQLFSQHQETLGTNNWNEKGLSFRWANLPE